MKINRHATRMLSVIKSASTKEDRCHLLGNSFDCCASLLYCRNGNDNGERLLNSFDCH